MATNRALKKDNFHWGQEVEADFCELNKAMPHVLVLALLDFSSPFINELDASRYEIGIVLMHNQRPITFFSQALPPQARLKSVYEQEVMVVVRVV